MDELKKIKHLLYHWREHNDEHAGTYRRWAEKAASLGNNELSNYSANYITRQRK